MEADLNIHSKEKNSPLNRYLLGKGREDLILVSLSVFLGIVFDYFFNGVGLGISYPLFIAIFFSVFFLAARKKINLRPVTGFFPLIPVFFLSLTFFLFSNPFLLTLNFLIIPVLIISQTVILTGNARFPWYKLSFLGDIAHNAVYKTAVNLFKPVNIAFLTLKVYLPEISGKKYTNFKKILTGLLFSLPLLGLVVILLASADNIFAEAVENFARHLGNMDFTVMAPHIIIILAFSLFISGYLWSLLNGKPNEKITAEAGSNPVFSLDPVITSTILVLVDAVYILFSVIQFSYLFGGTDGSLVPGYTYAQYARKGFFELVIVTMINLSILVSGINFVKSETKITGSLVKVFLSLLVVTTGIILYSAHFRMSLYEEAYGYTYLRLYVHIFMAMLFTWFLFSFYRVWKGEFSLGKVFLVSALLIYTAMNYINVDRIIAGNNVDRYIKLGVVDILYLEDLSYDALPDILRLQKISGNANINSSINNYLARLKKDLTGETSWQAYNLSREEARNVVE
jgi:hypothetical protein